MKQGSACIKHKKEKECYFEDLPRTSSMLTWYGDNTKGSLPTPSNPDGVFGTHLFLVVCTLYFKCGITGLVREAVFGVFDGSQKDGGGGEMALVETNEVVPADRKKVWLKERGWVGAYAGRWLLHGYEEPDVKAKFVHAHTENVDEQRGLLHPNAVLFLSLIHI